MNFTMATLRQQRSVGTSKSIYAQLLEKHKSLSYINPEFIESFFILKYRVYNLQIDMR